MNVAYDARGLIGFTGINVYTRNLVEQLARLYSADTYTLLTTYRKMHRVRESFPPEDRDLFAWNNPFLHELALGTIGKPIVDLVLGSQFRKEAVKYDLLHCTNPYYFPRGVENVVTTIHDLIAFHPEKWVPAADARRSARTFKQIAKSKSIVIVPCNFVRDELMEQFHIDPSRIVVTYEAAGRDFRRFTESERTPLGFGLNDDDQFFLHVGRIDPRKNIERLVEAYLQLPDEVTSSVKLVLVANGDGKQLDKFRARILQHPNIVHIPGVSDEELARLMNSALALTFVSLSEGFGIPILEAMACGCPVLTGNISSMPEIAGEAALLVDPYDVTAIASGLLRLATEADLRTTLRESGLVRVKDFSWANVARKTHEAYERALA